MIGEKSIIGEYKKIISTLILISIIGFIMIAFRIFRQGKITFAFLIWNLFLAWVPFMVSLIMSYINASKKYSVKKIITLLVLGFIWLIFYPNAPYIVTDIIHLSNYNYYAPLDYTLGFNSSFIIWYDFILVMLFVFTGYIIGHISLYIVHKMIEEKYRKTVGWIFVFIVSILSGFAIYLGRFLRLNSWEIISNPVGLLKMILESINIESLKFTLMFGVFIFLIYMAMYVLNFIKKE
ncbi:DUF1361 domain-containing protein [Wukongibacter baidiensis]|uniref:DUF1361 domain-containing protein n=1 Tax=Wukongibacter baidiensis TaxID=1723361 RepID=UPI003D7F1F05